MKSRPWEIKLTQDGKAKAQEVLSQLIETGEAICIHPDGNKMGHPNRCNQLCGKLFPSLERRRVKIKYRVVRCPCFTISLGHKIKVVRKLLAYNGIGA